MVPNPARKTAAARIRQAEAAARAAETARDAALLQLRSPAPGQAAYLTNQVINALAAPVEAAYLELEEADKAAAAVPARIPLGTLAPDMVRLDAETKQITHAIRMAAYNAETTPGPCPGRPLRPRQRRGLRADPRGTDRLRRHLPQRRPVAHPARPAHRAPADPGPGRALRPAHRHRGLLPGHRPRPALRGQIPPRSCIKDLTMSGVLGLGLAGAVGPPPGLQGRRDHGAPS